MSELGAQKISTNIHQQVIEWLAWSSSVSRVSVQQLYILLYIATAISFWHRTTATNGIWALSKKVKVGKCLKIHGLCNIHIERDDVCYLQVLRKHSQVL